MRIVGHTTEYLYSFLKEILYLKHTILNPIPFKSVEMVELCALYINSTLSGSNLPFCFVLNLSNISLSKNPDLIRTKSGFALSKYTTLAISSIGPPGLQASSAHGGILHINKCNVISHKTLLTIDKKYGMIQSI